MESWANHSVPASVNTDTLRGDFHSSCSDAEIREVYGWIVEHGSAELQQMALCLGIEPWRIEEIVSRLRRDNLVAILPPDGRIIANRPDVVAIDVIGPMEEHLRFLGENVRRRQAEFDSLMQLYRDIEKRRLGEQEAVATIADPLAALKLIEGSSRRGGGEIAAMLPLPRPEKAKAKFHRVLSGSSLGEGADIRYLLQDSTRFDPRVRDLVRSVGRAGGQVRTVQEIPFGLIVFDREIAYVFGADTTVIRGAGLVGHLYMLFEKEWTQGRGFDGEPNSRTERAELVEDMKNTILGLLISGMRDDAIARRLGVSVRTCRRHIAEIMERMGAESRFQAGYMSAQSCER